MRYSIATQALCSTITVSALALPKTQVQKRVQHVDISNFTNFPTSDPQVSFDKADDAIRELFNSGMFNDGPMDESGKWLDRPLAVLEHVNDKLELQFSQVEGETKGLQKMNAGKIDAGNVARSLGSQIKSHTRDINKGKPPFLNFDNLGDIFGSPIKQPDEPQSTPDSGEDIDESVTAPDNSEAAATCNPSSPSIRSEWSIYSSADRTAFVDAIKCLQNKPSGGSQFTGARNRYEDLISVHRGMTANIHQTAAFLVWHRYFVWVFEQMLRGECGFTRAMPWWDETKHAGAFAASDVFTDQWFGHLPAKTSNGQGTCIESGVCIILALLWSS